MNKQEFLDTYGYFEKEVLVEIIDIFLNEYQARIDKLYSAIETRSFNELRFDAHSLKGVVATFCDPVAKEKAYDLERSGASFMENNGEGFDSEVYTGKMDELKECVLNLAKELTEIKESF